MARAKHRANGDRMGPLYLPPTSVPEESEYRTLDNLRVRLAEEIDPRLAKTGVPAKRLKRESSRLRQGLVVALLALTFGATAAWLAYSRVRAPGSGEQQPAFATEEPSVSPPAIQLAGARPVEAPVQVPLEPSAAVVTSAPRSAVAAASPPLLEARRSPSTNARSSGTPSPSSETRSEGAAPVPAERAPVSSGGKVWLKPPGRKVWMK